MKQEMKKNTGKYLVMLAILLLSFLFPAGNGTLTGQIRAQAADRTAESVKAARKSRMSGLVRIGSDYYFFKKGKMVTSSWKTIRHKKYYFRKNGAAAKGSAAIRKKQYVFSEKGQLFTGKDQVVTIDGTRFFVSKDGTTSAGWHTVGKVLVCTDKTGKLLTDQTISGVELNEIGEAEATSENRKLTGQTKAQQNRRKKQYILSTLNRITSSGMSKSTKLRRCWNYLTSRSNFRYTRKYDGFSASSATVLRRGNTMLKTRRGNCYDFACAFAELAAEIGYKAYVCAGTCPAANGGSTPHGWVYISGLGFFDPDGQFAGWGAGVYGYGSNPYYGYRKVRAV